MSFIRPEAKLALWRWREVLAAGFVLLLGLSWINGPGGLLGWLGWTLVVVAAALSIIGLQRIRFRTGQAVPVSSPWMKARFGYLGPLDGGIVATREIDRLALDPSLHQRRTGFWIRTGTANPSHSGER